MNFSTLLKDELNRRRELNGDYSARAMARDLGISSGFFTQLLGGKRNLSEEKAHQIARALSWPQSLKDEFLTLVRAQTIKDPQIRRQALRDVRKRQGARPNFRGVDLERFKAVSEWYHFAIVELTELAVFKEDPLWIARRLGLTGIVAREALSRLVEVGLLKRDKDGALKKPTSNYSTGDIPSLAIQNFHKGMLEKAMAALPSQDPSVRDFSGVTMAIDRSRIPKAKKMIAAFRRDLMDFLEGGDRTDTYHLAIQLFSLEAKQ